MVKALMVKKEKEECGESAEEECHEDVVKRKGDPLVNRTRGGEDGDIPSQWNP